jgi:hypothetical protein
MDDEQPSNLAIGDVLKQARQRAGLDIGAVEEATKIRTRYLRALEAEEWDAPPGDVYTKSFLRTYAQLLGLDAEALVDEFRSRREDPRAHGYYPITEPMLRTRRRADQTGRDWAPGRGLAIGALIVILLVVVLVLGLTGGDESDEQPTPTQAADERPGDGPGKQPQEQEDEPRLELVIVGGDAAPVQICVLNGDGDKLFDGALRADQRQEFDSYRYELRFPDGLVARQVDVSANGKELELGVAPSGSIAYRINNSGGLSGPDEAPVGECE